MTQVARPHAVLPGIPPHWRRDYRPPVVVPRATIETLRAVLLVGTSLAARPERAE